MNTMKRISGILLGLVLVLGLIMGMSVTAKADDDPPYASLKNTTTVVKFDSKDWYLIDYDADTVTLLRKECVDASKYNESGSFVEYSSNPTIKTAVDTYYTNNISADAKKAVNGGGMFLLTIAQANTIAQASAGANVLRCNQFSGTNRNGWWLCSQGNGVIDAVFVIGEDGRVNVYGIYVSFTLGVRPALKLNLSSVIFESESGSFSFKLKPAHTHSFTYSASGATITASCGTTGCGLTDSKTTLTLAAPTLTTYGGTGDAAATLDADALTAFNTATGLNVSANSIQYFKATRSGTTYTKSGTALGAAPTDAGDYLAEITLSGVKTGEGENKSVTASVGYTIAPITISSVAVADITAPVATEALDTAATTNTEHVTLADSGAITWDPAAPQDGKAVYATTYKATVTAAPATNYAFADNATATVNGETATVTKNQDGTLSISYTFTKTALTPVTITPADKEADWTAEGISIPVEGMFTITEGAGEATYSVENGTGEGTYNAQTGKLTVTKCGIFTVKVSTAATATHTAGAETSATLTVKKANAVPATVAANNRTYDGTEKPLVTVDDSTLVGGTMQYALGTDATTAPTTGYTTSIPGAIDAGTYYVWYKVAGDKDHQDTEAAGPVKAVISPKSITGAEVKLDKTQLTWNGAEQSVKVTGVTIDGLKLKADDYTVGGNTGTDKGDYTLTVTGKGNFCDTATAAWKIVDKDTPAPEPTPAPSGRVLPLLEPTKENNALKLSWTQMKNVEGYDVFLTKCFTNFSSTPYGTVSADKSKFEFKGLKKQTMYKAYVRAYVTENGVKKYVSERIDVHCITGGGTDEYTIPVKVKVKDLVIAAGKTKKIEATAVGKDGKKKVLNHNDGKLRYISLNPSVATVSEDGTVKALKEGSAKILVMACNGVRTTVKVVVGKKAEKLSFGKKKYTVREGKTINLYKLLNIDPKNAVVDLQWKSGSKKTATVDANGVVTGVKKGTVTITVKDTVSGLEATVKIQVKKAKKK